MKTVGDILKKFDPVEDKYVSAEFQTFGLYLAKKLDDPRRKGLYIKMARDLPRAVLEQAYRFVIDANARNKGALFMWKLKDMGVFEKYGFSPRGKKKKSKKK